MLRDHARALAQLLSYALIGGCSGAALGIGTLIIAIGIWPNIEADDLYGILLTMDRTLVDEAVGMGVFFGFLWGALIGALSYPANTALSLYDRIALFILTCPISIATSLLGVGFLLLGAIAQGVIYLILAAITTAEACSVWRLRWRTKPE